MEDTMRIVFGKLPNGIYNIQVKETDRFRNLYYRNGKQFGSEIIIQDIEMYNRTFGDISPGVRLSREMDG